MTRRGAGRPTRDAGRRATDWRQTHGPAHGLLARREVSPHLCTRAIQIPILKDGAPQAQCSRFTAIQPAKFIQRQKQSTSRKPAVCKDSSFHRAVIGTSTPSRLSRLRWMASVE